MSAKGIFSFCIYIDEGKFNVSTSGQITIYKDENHHIFIL